MKLSIIIPVFNRPDEVEELLQSLVSQESKNFEVIIVEDGSQFPCKEVVEKFNSRLDISYYWKNNSGPGQSRNFGIEKANGDFYIFVDSDCVLPAHYMNTVYNFIITNKVECFGGPDKAHESFTAVQKAISYSMTSFLTTGGIRGGNKKVIKFHPRSFNMGFSQAVYKSTKGYSTMRFGEDIDLSIRIEKAGFTCHLIEDAYVFHKRRTDFKKFYKQIFNSGIARINLFKLHPGSLKLTHFFPSFFLVGLIISLATLIIFKSYFLIICYFAYLSILLLNATLMYQSVYIGMLSVVATLVQMFAYGTGFIKSFFYRIILNKPEFKAFSKNFYS